VFVYVITGTRIVEPTEVGVMAATAHSSLTLISCYPYLVDDHRIVVFADWKTP
jgi:sortase A